MTLDFVPFEHLVHIVHQLVPGEEERAEYKRKLRPALDENRRPPLKELEARTKRQLIAPLEKLWTGRSASATYLWTLPSFEGKALADVIGMAAARSGRGIVVGEWREVTAPLAQWQEGTRVVGLRPLGERLDALVRDVTFRSVKVEGYTYQVPKVQDVEVSLDFSRATRIAEVYSAQQIGSKALVWLMRLLTGENDIPASSKSAAHQHHMMLFKVHEAAVKALRESGKFEITGAEVRGEALDVDEVQIRNSVKDGKKRPLNTNSELVKMVIDNPTNSAEFRFEITHADGYVEQGEVVFRLNSPHPHVQFPGRVSTAARSYVSEALLHRLFEGS